MKILPIILLTKGQKMMVSLYYIVKNNWENIVKTLLDRGADPNIYNVLHIACENNNLTIVKMLLEHGADINNIPKYYEPCLYIACKNGNEKMVKFLLEHGAGC